MKLFNKNKTRTKEDERLHKTRSLVIWNKKREMVVSQTCGNYVPSVGDYIQFWHIYYDCTCVGKVDEICFNRSPFEDPNMIDIIVKKVKRGGWKQNRLKAKKEKTKHKQLIKRIEGCKSPSPIDQRSLK